MWVSVATAGFAINKRGQQQSLHHKLPKYVTSIQVDSLVTVFANFQSFLQRKFVKQTPQLFCSYTWQLIPLQRIHQLDACLVQACIKLPNSSLNITFYTCQRCSCNDLQYYNLTAIILTFQNSCHVLCSLHYILGSW